MDTPIYLASGAISVIGSCTLACKHCYSESSPVTEGMYSLDEIERMLEIFNAKSIRHVFLGGGEPLLHPQIDLAIQRAKILGFNVSLSSNGQLITPQILEKLYLAGLSHDFSISLDGHTAVINDRIRGRGAFVTTLRGMYELNKFGNILWGVNYVACHPNLGSAVTTAKLGRQLGASYFNLIRFSNSGRGIIHKDRLWITDEEFGGEIAELQKLFACLGDFYGDIYLYDLRGGLAGITTSNFSDPRFKGIPSGISIHHQGGVDLTPARIRLGNCKTENLEAILKRIEEPGTQEEYRKWLRGERQGVHQPRKGLL